ncbi:hypothetical protein E2C01_036922 [Portunus trituberculatus]|uniref:Uncharacterized protein n=1 Tax=Portunus trituberculatus TaxID=210409 RepID=A0A5B7FDD4_PORTR|nr:hypothetical protein [Portunus trituberculatus]
MNHNQVKHGALHTLVERTRHPAHTRHQTSDCRPAPEGGGEGEGKGEDEVRRVRVRGAPARRADGPTKPFTAARFLACR